MYCPKCGREIADNITSCPYCGQVFEGAEQTQTSDFNQPQFGADANAVNYNAYNQNVPAGNPNGGTGSLVLGILSLLSPFFKYVFAIISLVLAGKAKRENNGKMPGKARGGQVCSIISIVLTVLSTILVVVLVVMTIGTFGNEITEYSEKLNELTIRYQNGELTEEEYNEQYNEIYDEYMTSILDKFGITEEDLEELVEEGADFDIELTPSNGGAIYG